MFSLSIFNSACLSPAPAEKTVVAPRPEFIDLTDRIHMRQFALKDEGGCGGGPLCSRIPAC